jgi:hypothetical protein
MEFWVEFDVIKTVGFDENWHTKKAEKWMHK